MSRAKMLKTYVCVKVGIAINDVTCSWTLVRACDCCTLFCVLLPDHSNYEYLLRVRIKSLLGRDHPNNKTFVILKKLSYCFFVISVTFCVKRDMSVDLTDCDFYRFSLYYLGTLSN